MYLKKNLLLASFLFTFIGLFSYHSYSESIEGVEFSHQTKLNNKILALNGLGTRYVKRFFMRFRVYEAALYIENKTTDPEKVINGKDYKQIVLHFVRDLEGKKLADALNDGLKMNKVDTKKFKKEIDNLNSKIQDIMIEEGKRIIFNFHDGKMSIVYGETQHTITSPEFIPNFLKLWFGEIPPNIEVKKGLLGLK